MLKQILVKYLNPELPKLERKPKGDWIDLYVSEDVELAPFQFALVPLGVAMKLPEGYEAHLAPRSSTFKNYGVLQTNSVGVIDESYCGDADEWKMPVLATRHVIVEKGTRICQFRIMKKMEEIDFKGVQELGENRGGFGTTGK